MQAINIVPYIQNGEFFAHCKEHKLFDHIITSKKNITDTHTTYNELWWDFSKDGKLAQLLATDKRIALICDEFPVAEFKELFPILAQRKYATIILNEGTWTVGLLTKWQAELNDIDMIMEHGIACTEPADAVSFFRFLARTTPTYIRTTDKDLSYELYEGKETPDIFCATEEEIADPSFTLLLGGYLFQEGISMANKAEELGQKPAIFCIQHYNADLPTWLITSLERSERCVLMLDQDESTWYADYLASKLPPQIQEKLSFHFITPDPSRITSHYAEVVFEQAGILI